MPYRINCPACKTACIVADDSLGKKMLCGKCRQPFTVGNPKQAAPAAPKPPVPSASKAATGRTTTDLPPRPPNTATPRRQASQADAAPAPPPARRKKSPLVIVGVLAAVLLVLCGGIAAAVMAGISFLKQRLETPVAQDVSRPAGPGEASRSNPTAPPEKQPIAAEQPMPAPEAKRPADSTPSAANEDTDAKLPPDLDLMPAKEAVILSVHPAKLWRDPTLAPIRKLAETNKAAAAGLARLKQGTGLEPGDIERAVILFWGKQASPNSVVLVTTVKPFDRPRILGMIGPEQREEKVGGKSVISSPKNEFALHLINERTFLYGRVPEVKNLLELAPRAARNAKWNAILRDAPRHALQIAAQHDVFTDDPKKQTPPPLQVLNPLLDAHTAVAALDAGKELRLTLQLLFNDADQAKKGEQAARQGLELAAGFLGQFAEPFKKSAPGTLPPPLAKLLSVVPDTEAAVKKATIQTKESVLSCDVVLASANWPEALAAAGELFLASSNNSAPPSKSGKPGPSKAKEPKSP
jgi:hypothetical protein